MNYEDFLRLVQSRRSIRLLKSDPLPDEYVDRIIEAARWAPSGFNTQPWEFIVVDDPELLSQLSIAKPHGACLIKHAPLAVVVTGDKTKSDVWIEDCSIASIILQLAAEALGLGSCWVQIHRRYHDDDQTANEFISELLHIPDHLEVLSVVGIGYKAADRPALTDKEIEWQKVVRNCYQTTNNEK